MTRGGIALVWTLGMTVLSAQDDPQVFHAAANGVRVDVAVTERGQPVAGLTLKDFALFDSGVAQDPLDLSFGKLPIDVTIALDVSGSVEGAVLRELRRAIDLVHRRLGPDDRLKILTFSDHIRRLVDFTDRHQDANQILNQIVPGGDTAIFDALAVALSSRAAPERRQLVIMFSDGGDTASVIEPDTLVAVAQRSAPTLVFVLSTPRPRAIVARATASRPTRLFSDLAAETGGFVVSSTARPDLANTFSQILDGFRSVYVLDYTPTGVPTSGFHPLTVRVTRSGQYDIRARRGYVME